MAQLHEWGSLAACVTRTFISAEGHLSTMFHAQRFRHKATPYMQLSHVVAINENLFSAASR